MSIQWWRCAVSFHLRHLLFDIINWTPDNHTPSCEPAVGLSLRRGWEWVSPWRWPALELAGPCPSSYQTTGTCASHAGWKPGESSLCYYQLMIGYLVGPVGAVSFLSLFILFHFTGKFNFLILLAANNSAWRISTNYLQMLRISSLQPVGNKVLDCYFKEVVHFEIQILMYLTSKLWSRFSFKSVWLLWTLPINAGTLYNVFPA